VALGGGGLVLALALTQPPASAAVIEVDDGFVVVNDGDGHCSLSEAIINANSGAVYADCVAGSSGADVISLADNGLFILDSSFGEYYNGGTGLPAIASTITIEGNGATIARDNNVFVAVRLLAVTSSGNLTLNWSTLNGGAVGGPSYSIANGGAIYSRGTLVLNDSVVTANESLDGRGGALFTRGKVTLNKTRISGNMAESNGGGLHAHGGTVIIRNSVISGNSTHNALFSGPVGTEGGGVYAFRAIVTIENSVIADNSSSTDYYKYLSVGGGIASRWGELNIFDSSISVNHAEHSGGGLFAHGTLLTIRNSMINGNNSLYDGGGVYVWTSGTTISHSTISGNTASGTGGGLHAEDGGTLIISSTIYGNTAVERGGGLANDYGTLNLLNSTISGNTAKSGGGVSNEEGTVSAINSTFTRNTAAGAGGGVVNGLYRYDARGTLVFKQSLISGNIAAYGREIYNNNVRDVLETNVQFDYYNIVGYSNAPGIFGFTLGTRDIVPTEALSGILDTTLANNGGPTKTHALLAGSPAVDVVPSMACLDYPVQGIDQRGDTRNADGDGRHSANECDAGSFELNTSETREHFILMPIVNAR
jgi:hypothetical protein